MLVLIAVALLLLWGAGLYTSHTLGGFIHILLLVAMVFIIVRINQGQKVISVSTTRPPKMPRR
jgi:hypothetical protein